MYQIQRVTYKTKEEAKKRLRQIEFFNFKKLIHLEQPQHSYD